MNERYERYLTTKKTMRMIQGLGLLIIADLIFMEMNTVMLTRIALALCNGFIVGTGAAYFIFGIYQKRKERFIIQALFFSIFLVMVLFGRNIKLDAVFELVCSILLLGILTSLLFGKRSMINGDNLIGVVDDSVLEKINRVNIALGFKLEYAFKNDIDEFYFDYINSQIFSMEVYFPIDIDSYKKDKGNGVVKSIGLVKRGKYESRISALIVDVKKNAYLCPIDKIYFKGNPGETIAKKGDDVLVKYIYYKDSKVSGRVAVLYMGNGERVIDHGDSAEYKAIAQEGIYS